MRKGKFGLIPLLVAVFAANVSASYAQDRIAGAVVGAGASAGAAAGATAGATVTVIDRRLEMLATTPQIYPNPVSIYGHQTYAVATPMSSPLDNYYSGAVLRPRGNLNCWYGNGYDW